MDGTTATPAAAAPPTDPLQDASPSLSDFPDTAFQAPAAPAADATGMPWDQASALIQRYESDGRNVMNEPYLRGDPTSTASGPWQITDTNLRDYGRKLGIDTSTWQHVMDAPHDVQERIAQALYQERGFAPWAGSNPRLAAALGTRGQQGAQGTDYASTLSAISPEVGRVEQALEKEYGPQIAQTEKLATAEQLAAAQAAQQGADVAQQWANWTKTVSPQMAQWVDKTPSRQAIYATNMQLAPMLAILTAIGGKVTRASGLQMLAATTGAMQGLNQGSEEAYKASMDQYTTGFNQFQAQVKMEEQYYAAMTKAYAGREDAHIKAAEAVERIAGNMRTEQQKKLMTSLQAYTAKQTLAARLENMRELEKGRELGNQMKRLQLGQNPYTGEAIRTADGKTPQQVALMLTNSKIPLPGGARQGIQTISSSILADPTTSSTDIFYAARSGRLGMEEAEVEVKTLGRRVAIQKPTLLTMVRKGGILEQVDAAAKDVQATGWGDKIIAQKVRQFWNNQVNAEPVVSTYITKIKVLQGLESQLIARTGQATDSTRTMAAEEFPEWKGYPALHASLQASREANTAILQGDYDALAEVQTGAPLSQVADSVRNRTAQFGALPPAPLAAAPGAAPGAAPPGATPAAPAAAAPARAPDIGTDNSGRQFRRLPDGRIQNTQTGTIFAPDPQAPGGWRREAPGTTGSW